MYNYIRTACAVPKLVVGDVEYNTSEIIAKAKEASENKADIIIFPELSLTGYTCGDLFFQELIYDAVNRSVVKIALETKDNKNVIVVGAPVIINGQMYNCAIVINGGKIKGIVPKTFVPDYNEHNEKRWFSSSYELNIEKISSCDFGFEEEYEISVGRNVIFNVANETSFGVEICEDVRTPIPPSSYLALNGAEIILNLSASNEIISSKYNRRNLISQQSSRTISGYVYCSSGIGESTTDLVYGGHSLVAENGRIIAQSKDGLLEDYIIYSDIDTGILKADRRKNKSFSDSATLYGNYEKCKYIKINDVKINSDGSLRRIKKYPFVPEEISKRNARCMEIFDMQVSALKKRCSVAGNKLVVGISGGLDSTLALLVSAKTVIEMGKPLTDITGITMPCFGTSDRTYNNSLELMKSLGIKYEEINIKNAVNNHFEDIGHDKTTLDLTYENSQARERTQVLMDYAGKIGGFVVGTGDLSELALGWCTYNADHMSMYGVNSGVPKTLIKWMIESIVDNDIFPESTDVLRDIIETPISPELLPPDKDGKISQETEGIVGPYVLHDFFLYHIIRYGFNPSKVYHLAKKTFIDDFDNEVILKWLKNFYRRFFTQQFKRSCLPDGVKIGSIGLSPRGDLKMPSDASAKLWLSEVEKL